MKKVIVTGAAGFVGQNLIPILKKEFEIIAIDKHKNNLNLLKKLNPEIEIVYSDLSKKSKWQEKFEKVFGVIQLNAQISATSREPFDLNNIKATKNILDAMNKYKIKYIVHTSSAAVESVRLDDYAETKKIGEELVTKNKYKINYSVLRPSMMYGLFDNKNVGWLINFMRKMPVFPIPGFGKYPRQPVYVDDYANILTYLIKNKPKNKIYNINGDIIDYIDMVKTIKKSRKLFSILVYLPIWLFVFLMQVYNFVLRKKDFTPDQVYSLTSGDVFEDFPWWSEFGIKKTSFNEGLKKMAKSKMKDFMLEK